VVAILSDEAMASLSNALLELLLTALVWRADGSITTPTAMTATLCGAMA